MDEEPWDESVVFKLSESDAWVFRGQRDATWQLVSSLDRAWERVQKGQKQFESRADLELRLVRTFQRFARRLIENPPRSEDTLGWLSWMQHYDAPTRLLDFSYSPFVALFFALEPVAVAPERSAVWAIKTSALRDYAEQTLPVRLYNRWIRDWHLSRDHKLFHDVYCSDHAVVLKQNTFWQHQRLAVQQGVFLCPGNLSLPWHGNLAAAIQAADGNLPEVVRKFTVRDTEQPQLLRKLHRMNLTSASIYPGLEGFSRSLLHRALVPFGLSVAPEE